MTVKFLVNLNIIPESKPIIGLPEGPVPLEPVSIQRTLPDLTGG